jgi:hypothetical protein
MCLALELMITLGGGVKQLTSDKHDHFCIEAVERQSVIFSAASLHEARAIRKNAETVEGVGTTYVWTDEDAAYELGLRKFGVDVEDLQRHFPPVRVFLGWLEDWETGPLKKDQLAEAKLLKKYEGLQLYDPQCDVKYTILSFNLEFVRYRKISGWSLLVEPPGYVADGEHYDDICGCVIDDETAGIIADTEQKPQFNVQIISISANDSDA